jgi:hypothetical protein
MIIHLTSWDLIPSMDNVFGAVDVQRYSYRCCFLFGFAFLTAFVGRSSLSLVVVPGGT